MQHVALVGTRSPEGVYTKGFDSGTSPARLCTKVLMIRIYKPVSCTLPETNMETQKGPYKDYSPFEGGLYGFPC